MDQGENGDGDDRAPEPKFDHVIFVRQRWSARYQRY